MNCSGTPSAFNFATSDLQLLSLFLNILVCPSPPGTARLLYKNLGCSLHFPPMLLLLVERLNALKHDSLFSCKMGYSLLNASVWEGYPPCSNTEQYPSIPHNYYYLHMVILYTLPYLFPSCRFHTVTTRLFLQHLSSLFFSLSKGPGWGDQRRGSL